MSVKTGRAEGTAQVYIDYEKCNACGFCVQVCKGAPLFLKDKKVHIDQTRLFGCIGCGQCMAVCPKDCITIEGRALSPDDRTEMPHKDSRATYEQLKGLMLGRRSIRNFKDQDVEKDVIMKIIEASSTSPMGIPPSDVELLMLDSREKVKEFSDDMIDLMQRSKWLFSPFMRILFRPFIGKEASEFFSTFVMPVIKIFEDGRKKGEDWLLYNAPLAIYFHTSPYSDPADPIIPATYAMLAAESLGLGTCMIGTIAPFIKYSRTLKKKYGIPQKNQQGIMVIFGYPSLKYSRAIKRSFAGVHFY